MHWIDLRSDTVTQPTPAMREAMLRAEVGDDVYGEDPTVNALQQRLADELGFEAGLFVPSGTQSNLLAMMAHCGRGDEYIVGMEAHTYKFEGGGAAVLGSIQPQPIPHADNGTLPLDAIERAIKPIDQHFARSKLLCLENTWRGRPLPLDYLRDARALCDRRGLALHLDGARLYNAAIACKVPARAIAQHFDSVSVCFSKGLGAPVGSALCGSRERLVEARRIRKRWGGGMRQVGLLAAAARYALAHNVARIPDDHANAKLFATKVALQKGAHVDPATIETNIVNIDVDADATAVSRAALPLGLAINATAPKRLRAVTHLDVSSADMARAAEILGRAIAEVA